MLKIKKSEQQKLLAQSVYVILEYDIPLCFV
jgi:hypothetical protein